MSASLQIEVIRPQDLGAAEQALWNRFRDASPRMSSPYFDLRYILAAGACAPRAHVAVIRRAGEIVGFLPFQQRGRAILPLGAPMTDYHGVVAHNGEAIALKDVVAALRAGSYRFTGLTSGGVQEARGVLEHRTMTADLSGGFPAYLESRQAEHPRFFKGRRRNQRAIERDLGPLQFSWSRRDGEALDYVLCRKRAQYRRTGQHDIFACGWTEQMLRSLAGHDDADFGLGFATLRAGDRLVSAEIGLLSGGVYHLWLPVYEPAFGRYGPGMLMTLNTLEALAEAGIQRVDFGRDDADYKRYLAEPADVVVEGFAPARPPVSSLIDRALPIPRPLRRLALARTKLRRRLDVITACETSRWGWVCGAAMALGLGLVSHGLSPHPRSHPPAPRRPDVQRTHSRLVDSAEGQLPAAADDVRASAA